MQEAKRAIPEQALLQFFLREGKPIDIYSRKCLPSYNLAQEVDKQINREERKL